MNRTFLLRKEADISKVDGQSCPVALPLTWSRDKMPTFSAFQRAGEVREWTNRRAWRARELATVPWVRIPPSPPKSSAGR